MAKRLSMSRLDAPDKSPGSESRQEHGYAPSVPLVWNELTFWSGRKKVQISQKAIVRGAESVLSLSSRRKQIHAGQLSHYPNASENWRLQLRHRILPLLLHSSFLILTFSIRTFPIMCSNRCAGRILK
jgi:hypothetical protein